MLNGLEKVIACTVVTNSYIRLSRLGLFDVAYTLVDQNPSLQKLLAYRRQVTLARVNPAAPFMRRGTVLPSTTFFTTTLGPERGSISIHSLTRRPTQKMPHIQIRTESTGLPADIPPQIVPMLPTLPSENRNEFLKNLPEVRKLFDQLKQLLLKAPYTDNIFNGYEEWSFTPTHPISSEVHALLNRMCTIECRNIVEAHNSRVLRERMEGTRLQ